MIFLEKGFSPSGKMSFVVLLAFLAQGSTDLNAASNGGGGGSQRSPSSTYSGPRHQTHPDEEKSGLLLPTNSFGVENPVIVGEASPNVSASVGRTAKLKCKITDLGHKSASWIRLRDTSLISVGKFKYTQDKRVEIEHEPQHQEWILTLKDVEFTDEGWYGCQVNTEPALNHRIFLDVVEPYTEILGGKEDIFIEQESSINLTCVVHAPDRPDTVFWMHEKRSSSSSSSSSKHNNNNKTLPSSPVSASVSAYSGGKRIVIGPNYSAERLSLWRSESSAEFTVSHLVLRDARRADSGVYRCSPSNTRPANVIVHVLDGESTDALQTSGLSAFHVTVDTRLLLVFTAALFRLLNGGY